MHYIHIIIITIVVIVDRRRRKQEPAMFSVPTISEGRFSELRKKRSVVWNMHIKVYSRLSGRMATSCTELSVVTQYNTIFIYYELTERSSARET